MRAWAGLERFDSSRDFGRWLRGIARNVLREHWRQQAAVPMEEELLEALEEHCGAFQRRRQDSLPDELEQLHFCLERLPEHFRAAIDGRYLEELKGRRLAERLGISFENLKKRLQRARRLLLECMQRPMTGQEGV